jgi:hypothetical protein
MKRAATRRLNVQLSEESLQRLMLHSVMRRQSPGDVLSTLIDAHLREYRVQKNSTARVMSSESASRDDHGEETLSDAA